MLRDVAKWLEHGLGLMNKVAMDCLQKMAVVTHQLYGLVASTTNKYARKRFNKLEATNWCEKRSDAQQELIGNSLNKIKTHTDRLERGACRVKGWLPIHEIEKVRYLHCEDLTLTSRDSNGVVCIICGCILSTIVKEQ